MDAGFILELVVGLAAGIVSGLLGVGGGIIITPVLHYGLGMPWADAVALSLLVIAIQSPIGVWRHARKGAVQWRLAIPLTLGGSVGVAAGHWLFQRTPVPLLKVMFALLLLATAFQVGRVAPPRLGKMGVPGVAITGVFAGIISRLVGVGGGIVTVPTLIFGGVAVHVAIGTSLVAVFTNAAIATGANLALGLDWTTGIALALGAMGGAVLGVKVAHRLAPDKMRGVVGIAMILAAAAVMIELL